MSEVAPPVESVNQMMLFQRLRLRLVRNTARVIWRTAAFRPITIIWASLVVSTFAFTISWMGFRFLAIQIKLPLTGGIVGTLIDLMFLALGSMLVFSTGLILYGSLFSSAETGFLLSRPVRADQVFAYKFQGAIAFSSWAFMLLGGPVLVAYGLVCDAPWNFYFCLPLYFLGFVLLPGSLGGLACLLIVNYIPRHRKQVVALLLVLLTACVVLWIVDLARQPRKDETWDRETFNRLLSRFDFARGALIPSHWVATGLQAAGRGDFASAMFHLALIWSNGLFLYLIASWAAAKLYRRGFNRVSTGGTLRRRYGGRWLDSLMGRLLFFIRPTTRLLIIKDFRTFRREPQQWAQILIFCGLIVLYMSNVRTMFRGEISWSYANGLSVLNLCSISLLLCIYTGRFVFPMLSLEGRKFWVLGLLPVRRDQLLWGKFAFSTTGALVIAESLVILSDVKLGMPPLVLLLHITTVAVLAAGLSGLSVGLGAIMPNFRETDPSKIAVGFGGTLNLVVCLLFLILELTLLAGPYHTQMIYGDPERGPQFLWIIGLGFALGLIVGAIGVILPLRLGIQALRRMEF